MREEKQLLLDEIKEKIEGSKALILASYKNLNPDLSSNFRKHLAKTGGSFAAVKKRVLVKAGEVGGIHFDKNVLLGHVGVVFVKEDPVSTTKAFFDFSKGHENLFEVIGGHFEGRLCSAKDVKAIAELPSKDEMRAQFIATLEAPMSQTLAVMEALLTSIMHCLENKSQEGSK